MTEMPDDKLKGILQAKLNNTLGYLSGTLTKERQKAMQYYRGDLFGNEQEGRSQVVSRDVAEAIDLVMPSLVKVFATTDTYVVFSPRKPQDEQPAQQKTDYVNYVLQSQSNFFNLVQTTIKDGLLFKLGVGKIWWDESEEVTTEEYEGLTGIQFKMLQADENVEMVEAVGRPGPPQAMPIPGDDGQVWDCKVNRTNKSGRVCIEAIPPEEFLIERRTVSLETAPFAAHRASRTRTELIEMGFKKSQVNALPANGDGLEINPEKVTRFLDEDGLAYQASSTLDPSMEKIWVAENYLKVDYNGDGVAEWRQVYTAGDGSLEILEFEDGSEYVKECDGHPFVAWTPYLQPHKLIGESMADKTFDIQLWKSTVIREMNDGMYFNNAPQLVVVEGQANMDDVLTRRPGGVIRAQRPDAVMPLPVVDTSQSCMAAIAYIDSVKESRTGVRRFSSGLDADSLNVYDSTATGAKLVDDSSQDTMMLLARNYAEQFLKPTCERVGELTQKYQDKMATAKLRGQWVNIDPSSWSTEMDATVAVGLGTGNKDNTVAHLLQMLTQVDAPLVQLQGGLSGPLLTADNVFKKVTKLSEAMGFKAQDQFYTNPADAPPQPPKPDPKMAEVMGKLQLAQQQGQMQLQLKQQQAALDAQMEREKAQRQAQTEAAQAQADMATQQQQAQLEAQLEERRAAHKAELDRMEAQHQMQLNAMKVNAEIQLAQAKARVDAHVKIQSAKAQAKAAKVNKPK